MTDKIINCKCSCNNVIMWTEDTTISLDPCEHIIHRKCLIDKTKCPICSTSVTKYYTERDLQKLSSTNNKYYQKYVDIVSLKNLSYLSTINTNKVVKRLPNTIDVITKLFTPTNTDRYEQTQNIAAKILTVLNTKLIVHGHENITDIKKVIISTHTSILDNVVNAYLFKCAFLSSIALMKSFFGKLTAKVVPLLLLDRTKKGNTVEKIKEHITNKESVCLYPEGVITHPDTIIQFRTGAFHTGHPVQPVVIKYDTVVHHWSIDVSVQKMLSLDDLTIEVFVLPLEYPPFTSEKIESIRQKMAKAGNMALSRVSNKDINEDK